MKPLTKRIVQSYRTKETNRPLVLVAIIIGMFMAAIEGTIVSTAMPGIVGDLGGFSKFSWVFSAYLLMSAITVLLFGKLSDLFGRKPIYTIGIVVFLIGSLLCGFAESMEALIIYRLIQGVGAGAVQPIALTIVGDMYSMEERANIQGYLASVWGISAIAGPALGGLFVQYIDWSWVFWMNIPLGILSLIGILLLLHETIDKEKKSIDYGGAGLLLVSVSALMIVLIEGGVRWEWTSLPIVGLIILSTAGISLFFHVEKKAKEPLMPLSIWSSPVIAISNSVTFTTGMILIGVSSFLPTFVQGVMERSPIVAGFTLTTMSIGWPIASTAAGNLVIKIGFRTTSVLGGISLILGSTIYLFMTPALGPIFAGVGSFFIGVGMGLTSTTFIVAIQGSVSWQQRGIATATNMFMRTLGSAVGAALLGGILNSRLQHYLTEKAATKDITINTANQLLNESKRKSLEPTHLDLLQNGLTISLKWVYGGVFILALFSFLLVLFIPKLSKKETPVRS
ncbi:MDR family MFS transporter [Guptibacillus hwajinpoensis]|uniref:EmrB/QacA subfamily drug resistance transporter n=1 Tax=Guptibacillus hwajinpoensis TaxID=208199 RepID=A0ABU0K3X2_9BACL|nr:MDR family MFS transporter [Alkalihalobacillus hemicentroti]MDQ0483355.1 EmrB/QacA subfamily drug resistance transporter [Alkalihalobacillus hemicentroti]